MNGLHRYEVKLLEVPHRKLLDDEVDVVVVHAHGPHDAVCQVGPLFNERFKPLTAEDLSNYRLTGKLPFRPYTAFRIKGPWDESFVRVVDSVTSNDLALWGTAEDARAMLRNGRAKMVMETTLAM